MSKQRRILQQLVRKRFDLVLALLCLTALFGVLNPRFLRPANLVNLLYQTAPVAIAAAGQTFVIAGGGLDISIGSVTAAAAVLGALAAVHWGAALGLLAFLVTGAALGLVNGLVIVRLRIQPVIATIAMLTFARGLAFQVTQGLPVGNLPALFLPLGWGKTLLLPNAVWIALAVVVLGQVFLAASAAGTYLRAAGSSETGLTLSGVRSGYYKALAYTLAGLCAGITAILYTAQANSGQATVGVGLELQTIAAAVIGGTSLGGGRGTVAGSALGALIITALSAGMILIGITPYVQQIVLGFAVIAAFLWDYLIRSLLGFARERGEIDTRA